MFQCGLCNESSYREYLRHLVVRNSDHIYISPLTSKKGNNVVCHLSLNCNYSPSFEDFRVLCHDNKEFLLEPKESLLVIIDRPSINQIIHSDPLNLNEFLSYYLLHTLDLSDQFFLVILQNFVDPKKNCKFCYQYMKWLDNE